MDTLFKQPEGFDLLLRILNLVIFAIQFFYWKITEKQADNEKPKLKQISAKARTNRIVTNVFGGLLALQLIGLQLFPFRQTTGIQLSGFFIVSLGIVVMILARKQLGANWAHAAEYQIKKGHELVTNGVYSIIRHPIYSGLFLLAIGSEIVAGSFLYIVVIPIIGITIYLQGKREEAILLDKFGSKYNAYMKKTHRFIPYIW